MPCAKPGDDLKLDGDTAPARTTYVVGSASANNALPSGVSAYKVLFSADSGTTWSATDPGNWAGAVAQGRRKALPLRIFI